MPMPPTSARTSIRHRHDATDKPHPWAFRRATVFSSAAQVCACSAAHNAAGKDARKGGSRGGQVAACRMQAAISDTATAMASHPRLRGPHAIHSALAPRCDDGWMLMPRVLETTLLECLMMLQQACSMSHPAAVLAIATTRTALAIVAAVPPALILLPLSPSCPPALNSPKVLPGVISDLSQRLGYGAAAGKRADCACGEFPQDTGPALRLGDGEHGGSPLQSQLHLCGRRRARSD